METTIEEQNKETITKHQNETAGKAAVEVLKLFGTQENLFILSNKPEDIAKYDLAYKDMTNKILEIFVENNVGYINYDFVFDGISSVVAGLKGYMKNHYNNLRTELDSRTVGARNPISGKYDINHATHADIMAALMKVQDEQGNNPEDYYFVEKPTAEPVVSPIQAEDLKDKDAE